MARGWYDTTGNGDWELFSGAPTDHGSLSGLMDDDHIQYHTDSRADAWLSTKDTGDLSEGANLYYTEARVSANTDVAANTAARHDAVTVTDTSNIDFTLTGQDVQADLTNTGVVAGSYGTSSVVPRITVDDKGRISAVTSQPISVAVPAWSATLVISNASGGTNPLISAGDELRFRDSGLTIDSPVDGELEITADTLLTLTSPKISLADGFFVDLPSAGSFSTAFEVDTGGSPSIRFNRPTATTGAVVFHYNGTDYHTFGALNAVAGDVEHTDGTNSMTYDASLNELVLSTGLGAIRPPTMTTTQRNALSPTAGDMIYNTTTSKHQGYDGTSWNDFY